MTQSTQQQAEQAAGWLGCNPEEIMGFSLDTVRSSKNFEAQKVLLYGVPGIGKTTFAATFPAPILLRTEDGASALDVPTFPKLLQAMPEFDDAMKALQGRHSYKTLILDSLDWLEPIIWRYVCAKEGKGNIEDFGYGKGYVKVDDVWRMVQGKLEKLRQRGMHIVTIAHAVPITYDPPDSDPYQRYSVKLHKRAAAVWMEWADMTLFLNYKSKVISAEGQKTKAKGSGDRVIYTAERPAYQAKSRWPLDDEIHIGIDPTWAAFHEQLHEATGGAYNA